MKKFLICIIVIICILFAADYVFYHSDFYVDIHPEKEPDCLSKTDEEFIYVKDGNEFSPMEVKGVDIGSGLPGKWSTDFSLDKGTCLRWFGEIREMGANTVRIYTIQSEGFYDAFYEYNSAHRSDPLYLLQGVWVDEYAQFSHLDGWSDEFYKTFSSDAKRAVDVIHGHRKISEAESVNAAGGSFDKDISEWVLGYIIGVEWEPDVTSYTDEKYRDDEKHNSFSGRYLKTGKDCTPFEAMLACVGDGMISYESGKYKTQRILAFSNWPTTDPFDYPEEIKDEMQKTASIDVDHILKTDEFKAGQFASYHVYPYYPCYIDYMDEWKIYGIEDKNNYLEEDGLHTYRAYLKGLVNHHKMPVVISEFGVPSSRGMASRDRDTGRNQGNLSEYEQGECLVDCYEDIKAAGCAGACLFSWQDEWFKRTWNTVHSVNQRRNPFWSDYQTNEQYFGVLSFDPGEEKTICFNDGKIDEWKEEDKIINENGYSLSVKYDERYMYFMVEGNGNLKNEALYIPIDITGKSGSRFCEGEKLSFTRPVDFLIKINGENDSRLLVQERYNAARSTYSSNMMGFNTYLSENIPEKDSPVFNKIYLPLQEPSGLVTGKDNSLMAQYETGKLLRGNGNPESGDYNSISDYEFSENGSAVEIRIPWQLLNFSDPSQMEVHDDYYEYGGITYMKIEKLYVGVGSDTANSSEGKGEVISLEAKKMKGWGTEPASHERLKKSYYALQEVWRT